MRRLTLAVCCLVACAASAAPVPKGKGGFEGREWKKADPGKDCQFAFDALAGSVTLKVPASPAPRGLAPGGLSSASLLRPAGKGDFDARVRVRGAFGPGTTGAGLGHALGALLVVDTPAGGRGL